MTRSAPYIRPVEDAAPVDPLAEARAAGHAHIDAGLDALNVALEHFRRAEPYEPLLPPGVVQLVDALRRNTPEVVKAIVAIRDRAAR